MTRAPGELLARRLRLVALFAIWLWAMPNVVLGHGGDASIAVEETRLLPGSRTILRGEDLEPETAIRFEMITPEGSRLLAEGITDQAGHVAISIEIPEDAEPRYYELRATLAGGTTASDWFAVLAADDELLPDSEGPAMTWLAIAAGFVLVATGVAAAARRRQSG